MTSGFRIDESYLIGGWCSAALWGMLTCFVTFAMRQVYGLHSRNNMTRSKYITAAAILALYGLSTAFVAASLRHLIVGFIIKQGSESIPYFGNLDAPLNRTKNMIYIHSIFIADSIVVWRCYIVWAKNKLVIALPVLLILGTITTGYGAMVQYFLVNPNLVRANQFGLAMFSVSLVTNIVVTMLTVSRIWWLAYTLSCDLSRPLPSRYRTVIAVLIESGVVIAIAKLVEFVLYKLAPPGGYIGQNALWIVLDNIPQINAIAPTLIIISVNANKGIKDTYYSTPGNVRTISISRPGLVFAPAELEEQTIEERELPKVKKSQSTLIFGGRSESRSETVELKNISGESSITTV